MSSEENVSQLSARANRLKIINQNIEILNSSNIEEIIDTIEVSKDELVIIDSISIIYSDEIASSSGSITQIRYITEKLLEVAKRTKKSVIII